MTKPNNKDIAKAIISAPTLEKAAGLLGIHRNTLLSLRKSPAVKKQVRDLANEIYEDSINKAMIGANNSIDTLQKLAIGDFTDSQKAYCQLNAIKLLNEIAKYGSDLNSLEDRLEKIEGLLNAEATR